MGKKLFRGGKWAMLPVILALAWPTMLEQAMNTAVQYVDAAMVGRLGAMATAAVGVTTTINWMIGSTVSALGVGFLSFIARAYGAGDRQRAARVSSQAVLAVLVSGLLFTVLPLALHRQVPRWMQADEGIRDTAGRYFFILYTPMLLRAASIIFGTALRASGDTKTPMRVGVMMNVINVVLNYLLIYPTHAVGSLTVPGAGLGVKGVFWAEPISNILGGTACYLTMKMTVYRHMEDYARGMERTA